MRKLGRATDRAAPVDAFQGLQASPRIDLYRIFMAGKRRSLKQVKAAPTAGSDSFRERESISVDGATGK